MSLAVLLKGKKCSINFSHINIFHRVHMCLLIRMSLRMQLSMYFNIIGGTSDPEVRCMQKSCLLLKEEGLAYRDNLLPFVSQVLTKGSKLSLLDNGCRPSI